MLIFCFFFCYCTKIVLIFRITYNNICNKFTHTRVKLGDIYTYHYFFQWIFGLHKILQYYFKYFYTYTSVQIIIILYQLKQSAFSNRSKNRKKKTTLSKRYRQDIPHGMKFFFETFSTEWVFNDIINWTVKTFNPIKSQRQRIIV